ncbi:MAG: phosphatase PAP2 family protein [Rhodocyclaceae bacterium]
MQYEFYRGRPTLLALLVASTITLTACGGDDDDNASSSSSSSSSSASSSVVAPAAPADPGFTDSAPVPSASAFVDQYKNNVTANTTTATNPVLSLLAGFNQLWTAGATWDTGSATTVGTPILAGNIQQSIDVTTQRTSAQADAAYYDDRRNQNYSVIEGLGPLATNYLTGSGATTTITAIEADATSTLYNDTGTGAGSTSGPLGSVVSLIGVLRGSYSSTTPPKTFFSYPRPWRQSASVVVVPTLLPARSSTPATDGGFPSGHTNAAYLAALSMAYAVPERYQAMLARASELGNNRVVAGMHSPFDVIGGRVMATALAAAILNDSANASAKSAAYTQAHTYLTAQTGTSTADNTFNALAHSGSAATDRYDDYATFKTLFAQRLNYGFSKIGTAGVEASVPKGAEVLLETRLPYLSADQRRVVLRTTAIDSGYPVVDDAEGWGRLNLYAAADGYGAFKGNVVVSMDGSQGGYALADAWRNDISGSGRLVKQGSGALTLSGANSWSGGTVLESGTLVAASAKAVGSGDVYVSGGTFANTAALGVGGNFTQLAAGQSTLTLGANGAGAVTAAKTVTAAGTLVVKLQSGYVPASGSTLTLFTGAVRQGQFDKVTLDGVRGTVVYTATAVQLRVE